MGQKQPRPLFQRASPQHQQSSQRQREKWIQKRAEFEGERVKKAKEEEKAKNNTLFFIAQLEEGAKETGFDFEVEKSEEKEQKPQQEQKPAREQKQPRQHNQPRPLFKATAILTPPA